MFDLLESEQAVSPWMWNGLCVAVNVQGGTLRDWLSGAPPSAMITPSVEADERGGQTMGFTGGAAAYHEFAPNGWQEKPSAAITVYCRFRLNGSTGQAANAGLFSKFHTSGASPNNTWAFLINTANTTQITSRLTVAGTSSVIGPSVGLGSVWLNLWLRWQSGATATVDYLGDAGNALDTADASAVLTGAISYPATPNPVRVGGSHNVATTSPNGDFSAGMVWDRRLSDAEMFAVTADPSGFLRRAA